MTRSNRAKRIWNQRKLVSSDLRVAAYNLELQRLVGEVAAVKRAEAQWTDQLEKVYRVLIDPTTGCVEIVCLGINNVDSEAEGTYTDVASIPMWMQEKLAVLTMMKVAPPQTKIEGVGMRIDEDVYWLIKGD